MKYLIIGTIILSVGILSFLLKTIKNKLKLFTLSICIIALALSLISSYGLLFQQLEPEKLPQTLLNPQLIFFINVLIKFLIFYWIVAIASGMINPERISKYGAKFLGLEVYNEYAKIAKKIEINADQAENQLNLIVDLNRNVFDFLLKPFENSIVSSEKKTDTIRLLVKDILIKSYANLPRVKIHVIPTTEKGFASLGHKLAAFVRPLAMENRTLTTIENKTIGICIISGTGDLSSVIIIDTTNQNYEISDAEICLAGTFFVSIATSIHWAVRSKKFANNLES